MKPLALLTSLASAFAGQRAPAQAESPNGFPSDPKPPKPKTFGVMLFGASEHFRARLNPTPGDGRGHYLAEQHPPVVPLSRRLSRAAKALDMAADHIGTLGLGGRDYKRRVRELQHAAGHLIAKSERRGVIEARRAA